eukprot:TRINITY_DN635_c0_g1_i8.p1 TRINITY_DN635_c0_g1~~TRINITY_DN635_c0_g1_i8.p1  ORF type:complete len:449 (-),score=72.49 TRINITY_DN635_c0_g1_i8:570-1916(-)
MQLVVSQQSFDDAVQDNIEALGMSEEEAIQGVIEEFKLQGADLSGVVTAVGAKQLIQQHPLLKLAEQLASLIEQENAGKNDQIMSYLQKIEIQVQQIEDLSILTGICENCELLGTLQTLISSNQNIISLKTSEVLSQILLTKQLKKKFEMQGGIKTVKNLLFSDNSKVPKELVNLAESLCKNSEDSKAIFTDDVAVEIITEQFKQTSNKTDYCNFITSLISPDDPSSLTSGVFKYARALAKQDLHTHALKILSSPDIDKELQISVVSMLKKLCVNDEICKLVGLNSGVEIVKSILENNLENADIVLACVGFVRQLANSDDLKSKIAKAGLIIIIQKLILCDNVKILENCCAILSALMLRNPEMGLSLFSDGFGEIFANLLTSYGDDANVMRQVCQAVRNMVVRNDDLKEKMLQMGVEKQLKMVQQTHRNCQDVALAALRDLGVDDYQI